MRNSGQIVWDGTVHAFDLGHQQDRYFRAYAWPHAIEGGRRFFATLHGGQISEPQEAVPSGRLW